MINDKPIPAYSKMNHIFKMLVEIIFGLQFFS